MNAIIGTNVKTLREAMGWTQEDLAAKSKKPVRTIQRVESGEVLPTADTLITLAVALGVEVEDLRRTPDEWAHILEQAAGHVKKFHEEYDIIELAIVERASQLSPHLDGADGMLFQHVDLKNDAEEDAVATFRQLLEDWIDLWGMRPDIPRREGEKNLMAFMESDLRPLNLVVAIGSHHRQVRVGDGAPFSISVCCVMVSRADDPKTALAWGKKAPLA
ncbi:transcriptional regulator, XRE family [Anaeromyxobacter sp. K]|uniref:helix-turn-helix domain-containing protein n=1 Tax=Anaeromyxobacter sp. (strain K) TaxID=447217 RepID=UPI00015F881E|nr:helix-turn-helix transcriptional regulator [Anaeromyxobacter sp. K]ACG74557.1 transcriptional regulator, XRE family [Anaeromyxobacter sp. K]